MKELNSANYGHDRLPERGVVCVNEKNPCFGGIIGGSFRRTPTAVLGLHFRARGGLSVIRQEAGKCEGKNGDVLLA